MKAYLIDPVLKQVTEVEAAGGLHGPEGIYEHTRCKCIDAVRLNYIEHVFETDGDHVFVDDEGLINGAPQRYGMFVLTGDTWAMPLAGYGLVLGNKDGHEAEPHMSIEEVRAMVTFPPLAEIQARAATGEFD